MLVNTTREGELLDYAFLTQIGERRLQTLLDWQWEVLATTGRVSAGQYVMWFDFLESNGVQSELST